VNVANEEDESSLKTLESDIVRNELKLLETTQPVIKPFTAVAIGIAKAIASRNRNIPVQEFNIGLDFTNTPMGARLREGTYIAVQVPEILPEEKGIDWAEWVYLPPRNRIVRRRDHNESLPVNFVAIGVRRSTPAQNVKFVLKGKARMKSRSSKGVRKAGKKSGTEIFVFGFSFKPAHRAVAVLSSYRRISPASHLRPTGSRNSDLHGFEAPTIEGYKSPKEPLVMSHQRFFLVPIAGVSSSLRPSRLD